MRKNRDLNKLQPSFRQKVEAFMKEAAPLHIFITEGWRSEATQKAYYAQGRTTGGAIITWLNGVSKKSQHQLGLAIDIAFDKKYYGTLYPSNPKLWEQVAVIAKKHGIDWGYDLWQKDKPHFQDDGKAVRGFYEDVFFREYGGKSSLLSDTDGAFAKWDGMTERERLSLILILMERAASK